MPDFVENTTSEHAIQCGLVQWWDMQAKAWGYHPRLLFAVPNGGMRSKVTAALLQKEGVRAGVPDLILAIPNERKKCGALFIEMKTAKGKLSSEQIAMHMLLKELGYKVVIARSISEGMIIIRNYLDKPIPDELARIARSNPALTW